MSSTKLTNAKRRSSHWKKNTAGGAGAHRAAKSELRCQSELRAAEQAVEQKRDDARAAEADSRCARSKADKRRVAELESSKVTLALDNDKLQSEKTRLSKKVDELRAAAQECSALVERRSALESEIGELSMTLNSTRSEAKHASSQLERLKSSLAEAEHDRASAMRRIEDGQDDLSRQRKCLDDIRDQISRERRELERVQSDRAQALSEAASAKEEAHHEHHLAERLRRQIEDLRSSMDAARSECALARQEKLSLESELQDMRAAVEDEKHIERQLATRLDGRKAEMSAVAMDGKALVESIKAKRERAEALREDLVKIERKKDSLDTAICIAENELADIKRRVENDKGEKARLESECARRNELLIKSRSALESLRSEVSDLKSTKERLVASIARSRSDANNLDANAYQIRASVEREMALAFKEKEESFAQQIAEKERLIKELKSAHSVNFDDEAQNVEEEEDGDVVEYESQRSPLPAAKHGEEVIQKLEERYRSGLEQLKDAYTLKEQKLRESITMLQAELKARQREHERERHALQQQQADRPHASTHLADFSNQIRRDIEMIQRLRGEKNDVRLLEKNWNQGCANKVYERAAQFDETFMRREGILHPTLTRRAYGPAGETSLRQVEAGEGNKCPQSQFKRWQCIIECFRCAHTFEPARQRRDIDGRSKQWHKYQRSFSPRKGGSSTPSPHSRRTNAAQGTSNREGRSI